MRTLVLIFAFPSKVYMPLSSCKTHLGVGEGGGVNTIDNWKWSEVCVMMIDFLNHKHMNRWVRGNNIFKYWLREGEGAKIQPTNTIVETNYSGCFQLAVKTNFRHVMTTIQPIL